MDSGLPILSDMLDPDNFQISPQKENKKEEIKNIDKIKEEIKPKISYNNKNEDNFKETKIKETPKEEVNRTKEFKKENISKLEYKFIEKEKNYSDKKLRQKIIILKEIRNEGNILYKNKSYDKAIEKYNEGYKIINEQLLEVNRNRMSAYSPEIQNFYTISKDIMSNLSLSYIKKEKYQESIQLDKKIIFIDGKYDKSYARLFKSYQKLNKRAEAVFFGDILIKNFSSEVREKYKDLIPIIINEKNELEKTEKEIKEKEARKKFLRLVIPIVIIVISFVYSNFFK
jgi:hypothetical protein